MDLHFRVMLGDYTGKCMMTAPALLAMMRFPRSFLRLRQLLQRNLSTCLTCRVSSDHSFL